MVTVSGFWWWVGLVEVLDVDEEVDGACDGGGEGDRDRGDAAGGHPARSGELHGQGVRRGRRARGVGGAGGAAASDPGGGEGRELAAAAARRSGVVAGDVDDHVGLLGVEDPDLRDHQASRQAHLRAYLLTTERGRLLTFQRTFRQ